MTDHSSNVESDPFYPSGPWTGFFLQNPPLPPGRFRMSLHLTFSEGLIDGEGCDEIGDFAIKGRYNKDNGEVIMHKRYINRHDVYYRGFNEGKGVWGTWHIDHFVGGFHVWPEGMPDPTTPRMEEEVDAPVEEVVPVLVGCP